MKPPENTKQFVDLDDLMMGRTDNVEPEVVGGTFPVEFTWNPNSITPKVHKIILEADDSEVLAEQLALMITDWSVKRKGVKVPITKDAIMNDIPSAVSSAILAKINDVMRPNPTGSESSSSSPSTEDSTQAADSTSGS